MMDELDQAAAEYVEDMATAKPAPKPKRKSKRGEQFKEIVRDIAAMAGPAAELAAAEGENDERETPDDVYTPLFEEFCFSLDAASSHVNHKTERYCTQQGTFFGGTRLHTECGLRASWADEMVWCNPPFSNVEPWIAKAWDERHAYGCVIVLPNNRSEQPFWQHYVEPYRDRPGSPLTTRHLPKRRAFGRRVDGKLIVGKSPPFGLVLLIWDRRPPVSPF
jgi:hypothetical protein